MIKQLNVETLSQLREVLIQMQRQDIEDIVAKGTVLNINDCLSIPFLGELTSEDKLLLHLNKESADYIDLSALTEFANVRLQNYLPLGSESLPLSEIDITSGLSERSSIHLDFTSRLNTDWEIITDRDSGAH